MTPTVYHISPWRIWPATGAFVAAGVLLLVAGASSPEEPDSQRAFIVTGLFVLGVAGVFYWLVRFARLELSATGVKLRQMGYTLEAEWDNVASLYSVRGAEGIVLHRPMESRGASVLRGFRNFGAGGGVRFYNVDQVQLLADRRFIPIDAFAYWLEHGKLREELMNAIRP